MFEVRGSSHHIPPSGQLEIVFFNQKTTTKKEEEMHRRGRLAPDWKNEEDPAQSDKKSTVSCHRLVNDRADFLRRCCSTRDNWYQCEGLAPSHIVGVCTPDDREFQ